MDSKRINKAKFDRRAPRAHETKTHGRKAKGSWSTLDTAMKSPQGSDSDQEDSFSGSEDMEGSITSGRSLTSDEEDLGDGTESSQEWRDKYKTAKSRYRNLEKEYDKLCKLVTRDKTRTGSKSVHFASKRRKSRDKGIRGKHKSMPVSSSPPMQSLAYSRAIASLHSSPNSKPLHRVSSIPSSTLHHSTDGSFSSYDDDEDLRDAAILLRKSTGSTGSDADDFHVRPKRPSQLGEDDLSWYIDERDKKTGFTKLIDAIRRSDRVAVHQLLNHSANVNLSDRDNDLTPLQWAIAVKDEVIAKDLVLHGADVNVTDSAQLNTPLHTCLLQEDVFPGRFKELIRTLLYVAETNVNHQNQSGNTPLALAAYAGDSQAMELLLNRGCEVDIQNKHGSTPLMIACDHGSVAAVQLLLRFKANISLVDSEGNTALHRAVQHEDKLELVNLLLRNKSDVRAVNKQGKSALEYCRSMRIRRVLEDHDPSSKSWKWEIDPARVVIVRDHVLGGGKFGKVYRGSLNGTPVAVKIMHTPQDKINEKIRASFNYEAGVMSDIRHPNIVIMMGTYATKNELGIITEYLPGGSLLKFLEANGDTLVWVTVLKIAITAARGLAWLHSLVPTILHRDLHTSNILLTESFDAKVADFGLSQTQGGVMEKRVIYQRIMPPEVLRGEVYAKASDVYMFGLVLLELLTRRKVSKDFITGESFRMLQEFYSEAPVQRFIDLIQRCCQADTEERPSFEDIIRCLEKHLDELPSISSTLYTQPLPKPVLALPEETIEGYTDSSV